MTKRLEVRMYVEKGALFFYDPSGKPRVIASYPDMPDEAPSPEPSPELVAKIEAVMPKKAVGNESPETPPPAAVPGQESPPPQALQPEGRAAQERRGTFSLQEVLKGVDEGEGDITIPPLPPPEPIKAPDALPPLPVPLENEPTRKAAARGLIHQAVFDAGQRNVHEQLLYEQALLARGGNVEALRDLTPVAAARAMQIPDLIQAIIDQYHARLRRSTYVETIKVRALTAIDAAMGEDIDRVAEMYAHQIRNGDEAQ